LGTSGQILTSNGAGALPSWQNSTGGVTSITGTANQITASAATGAVTLSIPTNPILPGNPSANNFIGAVTSTVTAAGTTTLTATSTRYQVFTGSTTQSLKLPDATTLSVGFEFEVNNNSSGIVTIKDNGSNTLYSAASGSYAILLLKDASTANGSWDVHWLAPSNASLGNNGWTISGTLQVTSNVTLSGSTNNVGTITTGVWNGTAVTVPYGGTGLTTLTTAYGVVCAGTTATGNLQNAGTGTSGQVLTSNGSSALPTWQTITNSSTNLSLAVAQSSHGFSVGNVVYLSSGTYTLAKADNAATAEVAGIVSVVTDANNFTLLMYGEITTLSALTAGTVYFLSASSAGAYTATQVTTVGYIDKPLMVALSTTAAFFTNMRGKIIPSPTVVNQASSSVTMVAGSTYLINNGASLVTLTMPASTAVGDTFTIVGQSSGGWLLQLVGSQVINTGAASTSAAGSLADGSRYDCVTVVCTVANTSFVCLNGYGSFITA